MFFSLLKYLCIKPQFVAFLVTACGAVQTHAHFISLEHLYICLNLFEYTSIEYKLGQSGGRLVWLLTSSS